MHFKSSNQPLKGTTLVEVLVFTSIAATLLLAIGGIFVSGLNTRAIIEVQQRISATDRFVAFAFESEIVQSNAVIAPASGSGATLSIYDAVNSRTVTFSKVGDVIEMQRGTDPAVLLNDSDVRVRSFNVTRLSGTPHSVKVDITYEMNTSAIRTIEHVTSFTFTLRYE